MTRSDLSSDKSIFGRKVYIPQLSYIGARVLSAAFESIGIQAQPSPDSDIHTLELGGKYTSGDECLPEKITLGNFMKVVKSPDFDPQKTAFLLFDSNGPCRFGQYKPFLRKVLIDMGLQDVMILSPSCYDSYDGFREHGNELIRTAWRAVVTSDILRKLLLKTRPYELEKGISNEVFHKCMVHLCDALAERNLSHKKRLVKLLEVLRNTKTEFRKIPANYTRDKPLIGIVGEIFCRLNDFSNNYLIEKIEEYGGEAWLSDVSEWVWYTNDEQRVNLIQAGKRFSLDMFGAKLKFAIQKSDEHTFYDLFREDFTGYEEPKHIQQILNNSVPYLPPEGTQGEMILNIGKSIYLYEKGADGVIDISPFTCMNGIVCEAIYPEVSRKHNHFPIRTFYFDGSESNLDRDVGIFMELVKGYQQKKIVKRNYPYYFS